MKMWTAAIAILGTLIASPNVYAEDPPCDPYGYCDDELDGEINIDLDDIRIVRPDEIRPDEIMDEIRPDKIRPDDING